MRTGHTGASCAALTYVVGLLWRLPFLALCPELSAGGSRAAHQASQLHQVGDAFHGTCVAQFALVQPAFEQRTMPHDAWA